MRKAVIVHEIKDYLIITFGLFLYAFGWVAFLLPYGIACGGLTGISAIVYYLTNLEMQVTYFTVNFVLVLFAIRILGLKFCIKTIFGFSVLSVILWALQIMFKMDNGELPMIIGEGQGFMACVLGGTFCGVGLGIVFMHQGSTGGTDIIAAIVNKYRSMSMGRVILYCDIVIILSLYFFFHDWKRVVFGFTTMFFMSFFIDYIMNYFHQSVQFLIISKKDELLRRALLKELNRGVTVVPVQGGYSGTPMNMLLLVCMQREAVKVFRLIQLIDPSAFISQTKASGVFGEGFDIIKEKAYKMPKDAAKPENEEQTNLYVPRKE